MNWQMLVDEYLPALIAIRRQLHRYPELAFQEKLTAELVVKTLAALGLETKTGIAETGVVGIIRGSGPRTIAVRADMDALPIQEQTGALYASTIPNVMHACGHDGHVAIALGAAMALSRMEDRLPGTVKFIFQPAEEGPGGAKPMIESGVLQNPDVDAAIGFHLTNAIEWGKIGVTYGQTSAATDEIKIAVLGRGGHAGHPQQAVDAIVVAAQLVTALQSIVSRQTSAVDSLVISLGTISGGYVNNAIADKVELWGTVRSLSERVRSGVAEKIERLVAGITAGYGASYRFSYNHGYPPLITDRCVTALAEASAAQIVGQSNIVYPEPSMGGEDFAYFANAVPSAFFRIGSGDADHGWPGHHPMFDFAEAAIPVGVKVIVQTVLNYLQNTSKT